MKNKKIVVIPSSQGCMGQNLGCEDGGKYVCRTAGVDFSEIDIPKDDFIEVNKKIEKLSGDVFVGGDHSITYSLFKGAAGKGSKDPSGPLCDSLIIFDAHADCVNNFSPPTHEDFVRVLIEEGHVDADRVLIVGLRNVDPIEKEYLNEKSVKHVYWGEVGCDLHEKIKSFLEDSEKVYLSVDIDALDGEKYVGTGYPEKGGFSLDQLKEFVKDVVGSGKVVRSDLVEVNPQKDVDGMTVGAGSEILKVLVEGNNC